MEPPAKRARHGRAPHDDFADYAMPMDYNSKNTGVKKSKGDIDGDGTENEDDNGDDEDEIAMDPEDYAMKLNPQYRIQKSRAVADNKLKSAFELLFEKYSKDFGDTGDEINFYTDEIEVDNGHITSILAEEDVADDDDSDSDVRRNGKRAEEIGRGLSLLSTGPIIKAQEPTEKTISEPKPVMEDDEPADPTWAAPTIPDDAFSTPKPPGQAIQPPRIVYAVPHRSIFRKSLPESFGKVTSAKAGNRENGGRTMLDTDDNDNDDDLLMDTTEPILKFSHAEHTPRRRVSNWTGLSPGPASTGPPLLPSAPPLHITNAISGIPPPPSSVLSTIPQPNTTSATPPITDSNHVSRDVAAKSTGGENTETFSKNTMDPSYAFSDDEDFGLKKRNTNTTASKPAGATAAENSTAGTPTTEKKRGPGRPRKYPVSEEMSTKKWKEIRDSLGPIFSTTPIPVPVVPSYRPPPRDSTPIPVKRPVGRPRKTKIPEEVSATDTPTTERTNGQEVPFSSPQPQSAASTPSKPPTQELPREGGPQFLPQPQKRRVGRPRKIREPEGTVTIAIGALSDQGQGTVSGQEKEPASLSSPQPISIDLTPLKPPAQELYKLTQSEAQPQKRRVGRPKKIKDVEGSNNTPDAAQSTPASGPRMHPASAQPTLTPSKSPAQVMSPPLWQSVTQFQQKRRVGRPRKVTVVFDGPPPLSDRQAISQPSQSSQPSQELPQQRLSRSPSQPLSQPLLHLPKSPSPRNPSRAEIPDSDATIPSSNTTAPSIANRTSGLRASLRPEIPDSDANLSSSIIALVSDDDDDDDKNDDVNENNDSNYSAVPAAISSQLVGLGGSRLSPARSQSLHQSPTHSPSRLSPARGMAATATSTTPVTTARFVVIPRSGAGSPIPFGLDSGRASPLAKSVLRTPSPVKFSKSKLSSGTKLFSGKGAGTGAAVDISPSGSVSSVSSVILTPGGTMRRCGQDGFRCEREFCFKCA